MGGFGAGPFGQGDHLAIIGDIAFERDEARLGLGQLLHPRGVGGIGGRVHVGPFTIAEDNQEHGRFLRC